MDGVEEAAIGRPALDVEQLGHAQIEAVVCGGPVEIPCQVPRAFHQPLRRPKRHGHGEEEPERTSELVPRRGRAAPAFDGARTRKTPDTGDNSATFKWRFGEATTLAELGDPLNTDDYALCLYAGATLVFPGTAPAGGTCLGVPCWRPLGTTGLKYGDKEMTPEGAKLLLLKSGVSGRAKTTLNGKGVHLSDHPLGLPAPPLALPVRAQLQGENGVCFEATFSAPTLNQPGTFKASD